MRGHVSAAFGGVELAQLIPSDIQISQFGGDQVVALWVQSFSLAQDKDALKVPVVEQVAAVVNHSSVCLIDEEVEVLGLVETILFTLQGHDAGRLLLSMHDNVVPNDASIDSVELVVSLVFNRAENWEVP